MTKQKLILLAFGLMVAGCSPLAPRPDYARFFILTPIAHSANPAPATSNLAIGVGPIDFPGYLERSQVVIRSAPNELDLSPIDRWGEPLNKNFKRVLSENLAQLLNTYNIEEYPWSYETKVDYQIAIQVLNFETSSNGQSLLRARWIIKDGKTGRDLYASETTANVPVGAGGTGISAALSSDLSTLSQAIAAEITSLSQQAASQRTSEAVVPDADQEDLLERRAAPLEHYNRAATVICGARFVVTSNGPLKRPKLRGIAGL